MFICSKNIILFVKDHEVTIWLSLCEDDARPNLVWPVEGSEHISRPRVLRAHTA